MIKRFIELMILLSSRFSIKKVSYILYMIIICYTTVGFAQGGGMAADEADKRIKEARSLPPDAAAFQKYSFNPVSLNTGVSNISVPLFNVVKGELSETITLEYHTGGIKVNERATRQGLGWLLNAGGMITRTIQGAQADEHPNGFLNKRGLMPSSSNPNIALGDNYNYPDLAFQDFCYNIATDPYRRRRIDLEPDLFTYKFGDKSGVFYFSSTGKIVTEGLDPIKIETSNDLSWFKITDENGVVYMFELTQASVISNSTQLLSGTTYSFSDSPFSTTPNTNNITITPPDESEPICNGWNLTRIIHPNQVDVIYFDYVSTSYVVQNKGAQFLEYPYNISVRSQGGGPPNDLNAAIFEATSGGQEFENILTKIRYGNSSIEFNYLNDRLDKFVPLERLASIVSKDGVGNVVQTISLDNNSYFDGLSGTVSYGSVNNYESKRLKLKGVIFKGDGTEKPYSYRFKYNESNLPVVNATAQDYWGYHNGKSGNQSLIPETKIPTWGGGVAQGHKIIGHADRTASESAMKAFILEEIHYPTGGVQIYEYSSHKAIVSAYDGEADVMQSLGGLKVDRIRLYKDSLLWSNWHKPETKEYIYSFNNAKGIGRLISNRGSEFSYGWKQTWMVGASVNFITIGSSPSYNFDIPGLSTVEYDKVVEYQSYAYGHIANYKVSEFRTTGNPPLSRMANGGFPLQGLIISGIDYILRDFGGFIYDTHDPVNHNNLSGSMFYPLKTFHPIANRPVLTRESSYDKTGRVIHRVDRNYVANTSSNEHVLGFSVNDLVSADLSITIPGDTYTPAGRIRFPTKHNYFLYEIPIGKNRINEEVTSIYDAKTGTFLTETTAFTYDSSYGFVKKTTTNSSDGRNVNIEHSYPFDYAASIPAIDSLLNGHIIAKPIFTQKIKDGKTIDASINKLNGLGQLVSSYSFNKSVNFVQQDPLFVVPATGFEKEFDLSYLNGRLINSKKQNGLSTTYLWSYDNQYPIAEIKNAGYDAVRDLLGELAIKNFSSKSYPSNSEVNVFLSPLRSSLTNSLIKSSTYKPLVGLSAQIDEKNYLTSYGYNGFQQLKTIKDNQGHIIKNFDYNYTNKIEQLAEGPPPGFFKNVKKTVTIAKNDCGSGYVGTSIQYEVPAGRYSSDISQEAADLLAQNDIEDYGQLQANLEGRCRLEGVFYSNPASRWIRKGDCSPGMFGSEVQYNVRAEKYTSTISQADADAKAEAEIDAGGQGRANSKGFCELKGIKLVRETYSSEHIDIHIFQDLEIRESTPFPLGYRSSITLVNFLPGTYKLVCQSPTAKRFSINGISKIGTTVTFNNMELGDTNMVVTVTD